MSFVVRTFGVSALRRDQIITRGPRFQIAFDANAAELVKNSAESNDPALTYRQGPYQNSPISGADIGGAGSRATGNASNLGLNSPKVQGRYELQRCKVDSVSLGIMPGRRVAAVRWEGVSEGISFFNTTVQTFKNDLRNPSPAGFNSRQISASGLNAGNSFITTGGTNGSSTTNNSTGNGGTTASYSSR